MKKLHIALLIASFVIPSISFASIDANLKYGSRGLEVTELQDFLIEKGFLTGQASGNFFSLTRKAVVAYQASVGLPATGFVGPMTRTKINDDLSKENASAVSAETKETGTTTVAITTHTNATATNKIMTLQNGAVVEVDSLGNIVRTITPAPVALSMQSSTQTQISPTENIPVLSLSLGQATVSQKYNPTCCTYSAYISWSTNIPATSNVFITKIPVAANAATTQVIQSSAGVSTQGFVNVPNLEANTEYSYIIEAIAGTQDQKISGTINTNTLLGVACSQPVININVSTTTLTVYPYQQPYPDYNYDVRVKTDVQIYSNCGFDPSSIILVDSNTDRATAYNPSVLIGGTGAFGKVSEITAYHNFNSKISDDGKTITFSYPVNIRTLVAGTQYISVSLDHKQVQVAEIIVK